MFEIDTCMLCPSYTQTHTYVKTSVPQEKDFVNVSAIQRWQKVVSAVKWALCWAECNDSQDNWSGIWNGFHFVVTCWGRLTGRLASKERARALRRGCPLLSSLSPNVCSLGNIFFHSSIFIYASSPVQCSGISVLSEPEWEVQLCFSCYTCVLSIWHLSAEDTGPKTKHRVLVSQKDDSSVKAMFKQQRIFHTSTGLRNFWKLFFFFSRR